MKSLQRILLGCLMLATALAEPTPEAGVAELQALLDSGNNEAVLPASRRLLRNADNGPALTPSARAGIYALAFEGARRNRDLRGGNGFAADVQKLDRRLHGDTSVGRLPGLYEAAGWYTWADLPEREQAALTEAITVLEGAYGPRDARLARPLRTIAASCVRSRSDVDLARRSLDRALKLDFQNSRDDVIERAEVFATRGDVEAVFAEPAAGTSWYRAAWQRLADSKFAGPEVARERFAQPRPIYVNVPDEPFRSRKGELDHFTAGTVAFGFTVSEVGTIEQLRLRQSVAPLDSLPEPVTKAFRDARYRPRLVAGQPVATPDHGFEMRFSLDERRATRKVSVGSVEEVR